MVRWNYSIDFIYNSTFRFSVNIYLLIYEELLTGKCGQIIVHDMDRNPENIGTIVIALLLPGLFTLLEKNRGLQNLTWRKIFSITFVVS